MSTQEFPAVRIEIRSSLLIPGEIGLFAVRDITQDGLVAEADAFEEIPFSWSIYERLDSITQEKIRSFCLGTKDVFYAPKDLNYLPINWYMNHSCEPNVGFNTKGDFVAMRDIPAGEELCWDYGFGETNPDFSMRCLCGSNSCRGVITGSDWKRLTEDDAKYPYISEEIKSMVNKANSSN